MRSKMHTRRQRTRFNVHSSGLCVGLLLTLALAIAHFYTHMHTAQHTHTLYYMRTCTRVMGDFFACVCGVCTDTCMHCQSEHITIVRARPQTQTHTHTTTQAQRRTFNKKTALVLLGRKAAAARQQRRRVRARQQNSLLRKQHANDCADIEFNIFAKHKCVHWYTYVARGLRSVRQHRSISKLTRLLGWDWGRSLFEFFVLIGN